jgi:hypothetical protein
MMLTSRQVRRESHEAAHLCARHSVAAIAWLLIAAVASQAVFAPVSRAWLAASEQSKEESDSREGPCEKEVSGECLLAPSRPHRFVVARGEVIGRVLFAESRPSTLRKKLSPVAADLSGRNGLGGPLRC